MGAHPPEGAREDLHLAVTDPEIKAVFASIGGADAIRVLPHLDPGVMAANPKIFMGYSDTTMVHLAAYGAGLQTFYGPAVMAGIAENGGMFEYAERWFRKVLMTSEPVGKTEAGGGVDRRAPGMGGPNSGKSAAHPAEAGRLGMAPGRGEGRGTSARGALSTPEGML